MAMQESQDRVDEHIVRTLRAETAISLQQQQRVREQLLQRASQQTVLPPAPAPLNLRLLQRARRWGEPWFTQLYNLVFDDSVYCRAQDFHPIITRQQRPHTAFAAGNFMLLA